MLPYYLVQEIAAKANIEVRLHTRIIDGHGVHRLESLVLQDGSSGKTENVQADALFVPIGAKPHTEWLGRRPPPRPAWNRNTPARI